MYRAHCTDISYFFHVRYYVVLQVFWIGKLLRFDQRAVTCSVEWQQPYVHEAGVQVFWSGSNHGVATRSGSNHILEWQQPWSFSHNQLIQDLYYVYTCM